MSSLQDRTLKKAHYNLRFSSRMINQIGAQTLWAFETQVSLPYKILEGFVKLGH